MKSRSNPIECFLCTAAVQGKDEYKTHLEKGHNMSSAHNIFKFSNKHKIGRKARNTTLKRKQVEQLNNKFTKTNFQGEIKAEENFKIKFKLKSVQVNLKNIHMPNELNEEVCDDDLNSITWYNRVKYQCLTCERFFFGSRNICRHVRIIHKLTESTKSFYRLVSEDDKYTCKICNTVLKRDYGIIKQHLKKLHNLTFSTYSAVHEYDEILKSKYDKDVPALQVSECEDVSWYDRVKYQCSFCDQKLIGH